MNLCVECLRNDEGEVIPMEATRLRLASRPSLLPNLLVWLWQSVPSCFRLVGILREAGLPTAGCQALVTDPRVGFFGSSAVPGLAGRYVRNLRRAPAVLWNTAVPRRSLWRRMLILTLSSPVC